MLGKFKSVIYAQYINTVMGFRDLLIGFKTEILLKNYCKCIKGFDSDKIKELQFLNGSFYGLCMEKIPAVALRASSLYLLSSKGHSYVGVNKHRPVGDHGHLGHESRVHAGQALSLVDADMKASPWALRDHTPWKH